MESTVLKEFQDNFQEISSVIFDRAACGEWSQPNTPGLVYAWVKDELYVQIEQLASGLPFDEILEQVKYISYLTNACSFFERAGVKPAPLPWSSDTDREYKLNYEVHILSEGSDSWFCAAAFWLNTLADSFIRHLRENENGFVRQYRIYNVDNNKYTQNDDW